MSRQGQLLGHIVVFIIGLIVVSTVLYFGYAVLEDLNQERCEIRALEFGTTLSTQIERKRDYGIRDVVQIETPCEATAVCFVDRELVDTKIAEDTGSLTLTGDIPQTAVDAINRSFERASPANVFVVYTDGTARPADRFDDTSAAVQVPEGGRCVPAQNEIVRFHTTGTGTAVKVALP